MLEKWGLFSRLAVVKRASSSTNQWDKRPGNSQLGARQDK